MMRLLNWIIDIVRNDLIDTMNLCALALSLLPGGEHVE